MSLTFEFILEDARWQAQELAAIGAKLGDVIPQHLPLPAQCSAVVMACDDAQIAQLNQDFRGKPQQTNVLSWPAADLSVHKPGAQPKRAVDPELGDIAIAYETCLRESQAAGLAILDHLTHLLLHGTLHLLGYDHIEDADAEVMEALEIKMLASLGISNPYVMNNETQ